LVNEGRDLKFRLLIVVLIIFLSICAYFIRYYTLPDARAITANEGLHPSGFVPYADMFLRIDMNGKVLSVTDTVNDDLPIIEGIRFTHFTIGDYLEADNPEVFNSVAVLIRLFMKYELDDNFIHKIDIANLDDIHLYTNNVVVAFGSLRDADEKVRTLKEIMPNLPIAEDMSGKLDIRVIWKQYIFKVLT